jgi:hypothetical protein
MPGAFCIQAALICIKQTGMLPALAAKRLPFGCQVVAIRLPSGCQSGNPV